MATAVAGSMLPASGSVALSGPAALAAARLETQLRSALRERRLDPGADRAVVLDLIADLVLDDPVLAGDEAVRGAVGRRLLESVAGFGPLQAYLDDDSIEELWINEPGRVFVARGGVSELTTTILGDDQVRDLVERMLTTSGRRLDLSQPFVDAALPDGSRLHVAIPDVTRKHWAVNIRKFVVRASRLDELVAVGSLPAPAAAFLEAAVASGLNVVVSGGTQAGKTTMLNCLAAAIPGRERVISCEEVFELRLTAPDWVALQTRQPNLEGAGEIALRRLVKEALRMRPDRLIVGEVRQAEALDLLIALNSGIPGLATLHANSARDAIAKLCTLPLLAGANISHSFVQPTVAGAVDLVVQLSKDRHGVRRVVEIVGLSGRVEETGTGAVIEVAQLFAADPAGRLVRADGYPPHADRFALAGFDLAALLDAPRWAA
jgi:pilus assembly protein CpaF